MDMKVGKKMLIQLCLAILVINCVSGNLEFLIAKTIYNEAAGEGEAVMSLIASTIVNRQRLNRPYFGGKDLMKIINKYNAFDPEVSDKFLDDVIMNEEDPKGWEYSKFFASKIIKEEYLDVAGGATHFSDNRDGFSYIEGPNMAYRFKYGKLYFFQEF
jgi:hypothetical protein